VIITTFVNCSVCLRHCFQIFLNAILFFLFISSFISMSYFWRGFFLIVSSFALISFVSFDSISALMSINHRNRNRFVVFRNKIEKRRVERNLRLRSSSHSWNLLHEAFTWQDSFYVKYIVCSSLRTNVLAIHEMLDEQSMWCLSAICSLFHRDFDQIFRERTNRSRQ
jgi:hypothetical protein